VGLQYLEAWLRGNGCVPINNLMEDAATAEISRAQVWQWVHHKAKLADGRPITAELVMRTIKEELEKLKAMLGADRFQNGKFDLAAQLFEKMMTSPNFDEFLTLKAYAYV
jgi:malate synthase